jgi:hypothetical protein
MNATRDVQSTLDAWFETGSNVAPEGSIERAVVAAVARPQDRPRILDERRLVLTPRVRVLAAGLALLAIVASISLGPWNGRATLGPEASTPPTSGGPAAPNQPSRGPVTQQSSAPTADLHAVGPDFTNLFTSTEFGYRIGYPDGWALVAARHDDEPDRIRAPAPSGTVLSIRRSPMPVGVKLLAFAEQHLRHRAQPEGYCRWATGGIIAIPTEWDSLHEITIDGHAGAYRSECGYVDAILQDDDEFLGITLASGQRKATGDVWWFERFVETLEFADDSGS